MASLVLYHAWGSSASRKVRFCLAEKGLAWEGHVIDLRRFQHHSDWYKSLNPGGIVPCLVADGMPLVESNLIDEFLDESFPDPPLMPNAPADRHEVRLWSKYVDDVCLPAVQKPNWSKTMRPVAAAWSEEEMEAHLARIPTPERRALWRRMAREPFTDEEIAVALDILEDMTRRIEAMLETSGGPWLMGESFTLADIHAAPYVRRFEEERPGRLGARAVAWWQALCARPGYQAAEMGPFLDDMDRTTRDAIADPDAPA